MIAEAKAKAQTEALAETGGVDRRYIAYYSKLLQKYDSNSDGSLSKDEWSKMSKDPAAADEDGDGRITLLELAKWSMRR
jgi:Ca2+-binding EF-hand superfamily protein